MSNLWVTSPHCNIFKLHTCVYVISCNNDPELRFGKYESGEWRAAVRKLFPIFFFRLPRNCDFYYINYFIITHLLHDFLNLTSLIFLKENIIIFGISYLLIRCYQSQLYVTAACVTLDLYPSCPPNPPPSASSYVDIYRDLLNSL